MSDKILSGREAILALKTKGTIEPIETHHFGRVHIRLFNHATSAETRNYPGALDPEVAIFILCLVDENGNQLFHAIESDIAEIGQLPAGAVREVFTKFLELQRASADQAIKNSKASRKSSSRTA